MKTHLARIAVVALFALLALPAAAGEPASTGATNAPITNETARLEARIAELEARIQTLEQGERGPRAGNEAMGRVALLADRAMNRLVYMVRNLKRGVNGEAN